MHSRICNGWVHHRRRLPRRHSFRYRVCMVYLDLAELPEVFDNTFGWSARHFSWAWFRRADHMPPASLPLAEAVCQLVASRCGCRPAGPIRLLTHLRYLGYGMNPVSFYYCFDSDGNAVDFIVAEINNTPWGEQYCYVLDCRTQGGGSFHLGKAFHVSPFMSMQQHYRWRFSAPGERIYVAMQNTEDEKLVFQAGLTLKAEPINTATLTKALCAHPLMSWKITCAIYSQALLLWLQGTPFHVHPGKL